MWFFNKDKAKREKQADKIAEEARATRLLTRAKYKAELQSAITANDKLRNQLEENGFHIMLFKAAGGVHNSGSHK